MKNLKDIVNEASSSKGMTVGDLIKHLQKNYADNMEVYFDAQEVGETPLFEQDIYQYDDKTIIFQRS